MRHLISILLIVLSLQSFGQTRPKVVVTLVVDQMRVDYLYRYWDRFEDGGFKRLVGEGALCSNAHFNYTPTFTGPGHASIFTGTTPAYHGIVSNDWYDRATQSEMYCVKDKNVNPIGTESPKAKRSPKNLLSSTISDELEITTNGKAITVGISLKDRGAILPAGHAGDHAYWMEEGKFATSSWYADALPKWVEKYNSSSKLKSYIKAGWKPLHPIESYKASQADDNPWEKSLGKKATPTFPYPLEAAAKRKGMDIIKRTPFGNTMLCDFAMLAIKELGIGTDNVSDFLSVSFSSTDYIGHGWGPQAVETEDAYLRLDQDISRLLATLDNVAKDQYVVVLTADHGGAWNPNHAKSLKLNSGNIKKDSIVRMVTGVMSRMKLDTNGLAYCSDGYIYLNKKIKPQVRKRLLAGIRSKLVKHEGIRSVINLRAAANANLPELYKEKVLNGMHPIRSADYQIIFEPGWIEYGKKGTTHGSGYDYDTHVPIIFMGQGIKKGECLQKVVISDIAPTLSHLLKISNPDACTGNLIRWVLK